MKALVLRFDAPMMSFGTVMVDQHGFIDTFPGQSMLTGLCANALGWEHGDFQRLQELQDRIRYAARWDVEPRPMVDYHTADLGQPKMMGYAIRGLKGDPVGGWTTRGAVEHRDGGDAAKFGTHQRYRHYWIDGLLTVVLGLTGAGQPDIGGLEEALRRPARPLFLGRRTCLPSRPLLDPHQPIMEGENVRAILENVTVWDRAGQPVAAPGPVSACWPAELGEPEEGRARPVYDLRDWANQVHAGGRLLVQARCGGESR